MIVPDIDQAGVSDAGPVREDNQDAIRLPDGSTPAWRGLLFALADGMGGYPRGDLASALALQTLFQVFYDASRSDPPGRNLRRSLDQANLAVYDTAQRLGVGRMGTTLTAMHLQGSTLRLAHVGDSRAYLVRDSRATCLTNDHTVVGDLVRMRLLAPSRVRTHEQRSVLNKALGLALFVQPDITELALQRGDRLILCSDGVWSVIEDDEFARLAVRAPNAAALSQDVVNLAVNRGTDDNASAVTLHIRQLAPDAPADALRRRGITQFVRGYLSGRGT